ncbi:MAG: immune inhibitor A [Candidatus Lokiarchaeota archaeon]|nr:immune inhibitor A [Candidatus Lokiarchaeota archaeon]
MRNSKIAKITLVGLLLSTSIGIVSAMLTFNFNVEDPLPIYESLDIGPTIRSTIYPYCSSGNFELQSSSYLPEESLYYDIGDVLEWPVWDQEEGIYLLDPYELRAFGEVSEIWVQTDMKYPDGDNRDEPIITEDQITYILAEFEFKIYDTVVEYFGMPDSHYGDPDGNYYQENGRSVILISNIRDQAYYDKTYPYYTVGYYDPQLENDYDRNIISIDSYDWENRVGDDVERPNVYEATIAHEYQHLIHDDYNPDDEIFMNEGCSMYAEPLCGYPIAKGDIEAYLATPDNSLTEWADQGDINILADYGNALLWTIYLSDHYGGAPLISYFVKSGIPGVEGLNAALTEFKFEVDFDQIYHDWRITNLIHTDQIGDGKYDYVTIDLGNFEPANTYEIKRPWFPPRLGIDFGTTKSYLKDDTGISMVSSYGSDYIKLSGLKDSFVPDLYFDGDDTASPITWITEDMDGDGDFEWYSTPSAPESDLSIKTTLNMTDLTTAVLSFKTSYEIEPLWDYGFVQISLDEGESWISLANEYTTMNHVDEAYPAIIDTLPGLTGVSDGWIEMSFDLTDYVGQFVDLCFRYMTDWGYEDPGWWIDDIALNGVIFDNADDLTSFVFPPDPPTEFIVTLIGVDESGENPIYDGDKCSTFMLDGDNEMIKSLNSYMAAEGYVLVIISPIVGPADYQFEVRRG